jgi:hypothetical protein
MLHLSQINWLNTDLQIVFEGDQEGQREVVCRFVELLHMENRLCCQSFSVAELPVPVREHPLLWDWTEGDCELYFAAAPGNPDAVIIQLTAAHDTLAGKWFPFSTWLAQPDLASQVRLLRLGAGFFARGPERVMHAYKEILDFHACRPSLLREGSGDEMDLRTGPVALQHGGIGVRTAVLRSGTEFRIWTGVTGHGTRSPGNRSGKSGRVP